MNAPKLLADQPQRGDSLVQVLVEGLRERSRLKMTEGLRKFIVDIHEAVKLGDLEKTLESLSVVEPQFGSALPDVTVREGVDELPLEKGEEGT